MYKLLKSSLIKQRKWLIMLFAIYIYSGSIGIIVPYMNSYFIDSLIKQPTLNFIIKFFMLLGIISLIHILFTYIFSIIKSKVIKNIAFDIQMEVINHIEHIPYEKISKENLSYLHNRVEQDVSQITVFFVNNIYDIIMNTTQLIILLILFFTISYKIFIIVLLFIPCYIAIYLLMKKSLYVLGLDSAEETNKYYAYIDKEYERFRETRTYADYNNRKNRMKCYYYNYLQSFLKYLKKTLKFSSLDQLITLFFQIVMLLIGGISIVNGEMTIGTYTLINIYFSMILNGIKFFFNFGKEYQVTKVSSNRIYELYNTSLEKIGSINFMNIHKIELKNFNYKFNRNKVLKNNLDYIILNPGIYTIVGQNGSGKTTLINSIIGIYNIGKIGEILINDINIEKIDTIYLRKNNISVMIQSEIFPELTVKQYMKEYLSINNIENIFKKKELLKRLFESTSFNIVDHLDKKLQNLSAGEKQMISLFSLLIKNKDVYILDEPTSNIYKELKPILIDILIDLVEDNKIVLIISHDQDIISISNNIIKL